jgi:hypothetical protein
MEVSMNTSGAGSMRWALSMALAMCAHGALADDAAKSVSTQKASAQSSAEQNGLMSFPNVSLEHAPQAATEPSRAPASAAGMRVYIDPVTKERRAQTLEEAQREAAVSVKRPVAGKVGAQAASDTSRARRYGPGNTVMVMLGDESTVYQVMHRDPGGEISQQCVTGKDAAAQALTQEPKAVERSTEVHHER